MDFSNLGRILFTIFCFVIFIVILISAYSKSSKKRYEEEALRVALDDDTPHATDNSKPSSGAKK